MDHAEILADYKACRKAGMSLNTRLSEMLSREDLGRAADDLGMRHGKEIQLETEDEIHVLFDYAIYDIYRDGCNAVDRLLRKDPPKEGSLELRCLRAMQVSEFGLFKPTSVIAGLGIHGWFGEDDRPLFLVDVGLSQTATPDHVFAMRIYSPGVDWWMSTGAGLPLSREAIDQIIDEIDSYVRDTEQELSPHVRAKLTIRGAIAAGASHSIRYDHVVGKSSPGSPQRLARSSRVGRNDPCPCGSGKKYKNCCGR